MRDKKGLDRIPQSHHQYYTRTPDHHKTAVVPSYIHPHAIRLTTLSRLPHNAATLRLSPVRMGSAGSLTFLPPYLSEHFYEEPAAILWIFLEFFLSYFILLM